MMPMADVFAPDVNFLSARSAYPTAPGGTVANAAAPMSASTNTTTVDPATGQVAPVSQNVGVGVKGHSVIWWVGLLGLLVALVFVARKTGTEEDFRNIKPTGYNFLTITLTSIVGIVALKTLAAKYRIPGASDVILAA